MSFCFDDIKKPHSVNLHTIYSAHVKLDRRLVIFHPYAGVLTAIETIKDPDTGLVLWEPGATITYHIGRYDKNLALTYLTTLPKGSMRSTSGYIFR